MIQIYSPGNENFEYNGDMTLKPTNCPLTVELNGAWELTLDHPLDSEGRYKYIKNGAVIKAPSFNGEQFFRIYNANPTMDGVTANARPIFMDAANDCFLMDVRPTEKDGQGALDIMCAANTKYSGQSNIAKVNTAYYIRQNLIEAINGDIDQSFINRWGGEIVFDNYTIIINSRAGSNKGAEVRYRKNISGVNCVIDTSSLITRIVPLAYNGYTIDGETPWVDSENINKYPIIYYSVVQYDDVKMAADAEEDDEENGVIICNSQDELNAALRQKALDTYENDKVDQPVATIEIDMIQIENTEEYKEYKTLEQIGIGDDVRCIYRPLDIDIDSRVIALTYDCISERVTDVTLGKFQPNYFDNVSSVYDKAENIFNTDGTINADWLNGTINALNVKFKALRDIAQKQDVRAILFEDLDPESPTFGAMCLGTMGFEISNKRNSTDTDWDWRTFGTGAGFTCDVLIAGKLMGARFEMDLNAGTVKFGERDAEGNITDPVLYYGPDKFTIKFDNNFATTDDLENYPTNDEMQEEISAQIELSEQGLTAQFNKTLQDNYSTTEQMNTAIQVSADGINVNLQQNYYTAQQTQTIIDNKEETINDKIDGDINAAEDKLIESYTAAINLSAQNLTTQFNQTLTGYADKEALNSAISQSAQNLTVQFNQTLNNYATNSAVQDMEIEITQEYKAAIEASAQSLKSELSASITAAAIGGENLFSGTSLQNTNGIQWESTDGSAANIIVMPTSKSLSGMLAATTITTAGTGELHYTRNKNKLQAGHTYTWQVTVGAWQDTTMEIGVESSNGTKSVEIKAYEYEQVTLTFTPDSTDTTEKDFVFRPLSALAKNDRIEFYDLKMVQGDTITAWTPAAEDVIDRLDQYMTEEAVSNSVSGMAATLTDQFNQKFGDYPTKIEMNGAIEQTAAGLTSQFTATLSNYSSTMQMNSAIEQRADAIMSTVNTKVGKTEMSTQIQQNATAVRLAWNNYTEYVQFEQARLNIYNTGDNLVMSLGNDGMGLYRNDNNAYIGKIGTNNISGHPEWKGLVFDLEYNGEYMTWGAKQSSSATTYAMMWTYSRDGFDQTPQGLSAGCHVDIKNWRLKRAFFENCWVIPSSGGNTGYAMVYNHGGVTSLGFVYYTGGTPQRYGYLEVATTDRGMVGIDAWQSDGRLKKNITPATGNATAVINNISVREFDWKDDGAHEDFGLIAQEVEKIDPRMVFKVAQRDENNNVVDERYQLRESQFIPLLIKSVQELSKRIEYLESEKEGIQYTKTYNKEIEEEVQQYEDDIIVLKREDNEPIEYKEPAPLLYKKNEDGTIEFLKNESEE